MWAGYKQRAAPFYIGGEHPRIFESAESGSDFREDRGMIEY